MNASHLVTAGDGVRLAVSRSGPAARRTPPVVVLHGFTGDSATMAEVVRPLATRRSVVAVDVVGHGRSDAPGEVERYSMEAVVEQILTVCRAHHDGEVDLVGYSMGGRIALSLAVLHPDAVRAMALIGASAGIADPSERTARRAADEALADRIERHGLEWFVDHWMALPLFASQRRLGRDLLAAQRSRRLTNRAHGLANSLRGTGTGAQPAWHDRLGRLRARVTFVAGQLDTKYCTIAAELAAATPGARAVVVPRAGHAAHLEEPDAVARVVSEALE